MSDLNGEVLGALVMAPQQRKEAALRVLRGEAEVRQDVEPYLTLGKVGRRLGISACTLWRYGVPSHTFGNRAWFRMSEVEEHLKAMEGRERQKAKG